MKFDAVLSTITTAALIGLVVLNWEGATKLLAGVTDSVVKYIGAVQGR